jgi:hypothetical protein
MQPMVRSAGPTPSLVDRMIGVSTLKQPFFADIRRDTDATGQALIVVALAAIAAGIGAAGQQEPGIIWQVIKAIGGWVIFSVVAFFIGSMFNRGGERISLGQVLRLMGFAQAPKIIGALAIIPLIGWIAGLAAAIWFLIVAIVALREAFHVPTGTAAAIGVLSLAVVFVVSVIVGTVLNIAGGILSWLF